MANEIMNLFVAHKALGFLSMAIIVLSYMNKHGYLSGVIYSTKLISGKII